MIIGDLELGMFHSRKYYRGMNRGVTRLCRLEKILM
jgi:hypothetical protein